jgi:hypothetical protein
VGGRDDRVGAMSDRIMDKMGEAQCGRKEHKKSVVGGAWERGKQKYSETILLLFRAGARSNNISLFFY